MANMRYLIIAILIGSLNNISAQTDNKGEKYIYEFRDGTTIIGVYDRSENGNIYIKDIEGEEVYIPKIMVAQIHKVTEDNIKNDEYWFPNLHDTRYFFAPTGFGLKQGEGYFNNLYWIVWQAQWGVTDKLSIGGGTSYFGIPTTLNVKYSETLIENDLNFSAGWFWIGSLFWDTGDRTFVNMPFGLITKGSKENNFTLGFGYNFADNWVNNNRHLEYNDNGNYEWIEDPVKASQRITVNAGATFRASRRFSFIAEAWLFNPRDPTLLGGPGIRYFRKINRVTAKNGAGAKTFDFQLLMSPEWDGIIPMIGASQKF